MSVLWDFWLLARSFRRETIFDPLSSPADVLRLVSATKQVLGICQENIKVNVSECTSSFRKRGLVICQRGSSFPTHLFLICMPANIGASSQTWNETRLDPGEFFPHCFDIFPAYVKPTSRGWTLSFAQQTLWTVASPWSDAQWKRLNTQIHFDYLK